MPSCLRRRGGILKIIFYWVLYPLIRPFYLISVILNTLVLALIIIIISPLDRKGNIVHYIGRFWSFLNVYLSGTKGQTYIVMSNHQSLFDVWALIAKIPLQLRWIIKSDIKKMPVFGYALERMGHIYIDKSKRKDTAFGLEAAARKITGGTSVVIFPEGTRSKDGRLQKFHRGGALIGIRSGMPILPITVNGSRFVLPKGTLALMPGKIEIVVSDLIDPGAFDENGKNELTAVVKSAIEKNIDLEYGDFTLES
jgi:1-acyl-sn-glycerol-3-phosphate acyltransferase